MHALLASIPIALVIVALAGLRWRAASAGLLGLATALVLGVGVFGLGTQTYPQLGPALAVGGAMAEALFTTASILWIIFPALCIYELQQRSGAFDVIQSALSRLSEDPRILVLLVAWFFGLFMEGVAGFGTPVALAAPILVGLGFSPVRAVTLALIGHAAGVSFGAIGTPVLPLMAATDLSGVALARASALPHTVLGWMLVAVLFVMSAPERPRLRDWRWPALAGVSFFVPYFAVAALVGPELPTLGAALIGGTIFAVILRSRTSARGRDDVAQREDISTQRESTPLRDVINAVLPYLVLLFLILASRLIPPLRSLLREASWHWTLMDAFSGKLEPLYHPGTLLFVGFLLGGALQGRTRAELIAAMAGAAGRLTLVLVALAAMLGLSRILVHAGMTDALAAAAAGIGAGWPLVAPFIGVLGAFITGSATSSNILFAEFQQATALTLSMPVTPLLGAQNFGAAIGNIISPHNIIAGAATVGLASGREGEVMRATLLLCLGYAAAGGVVTALLIALQ